MTIRILLSTLLMASCLLGSEWFPVQIESPEYPPLGNQSETAGTVVLKVLLGTGGEVSAVEVVSGNPLLAEAARNNVRLWKFAQQETSASKAPSSIKFTYVFTLNGEAYSCPKTHFRYEHPFKAIVSSQPLHWMPSNAIVGK